MCGQGEGPKCVINARDLRLHQINVAVPSFLIPGSIPEGVLQVELPFRFATKAKATPSQSIIKEEEGEEIIDVSYSKDDYEVFNQPQSPKIRTDDLGHLLPTQVSHDQEATDIPDAMGIQRKSRSSL